MDINIGNVFEALALKINEKIDKKEIETVPDKGIRIGIQNNIKIDKGTCCTIM